MREGNQSRKDATVAPLNTVILVMPDPLSMQGLVYSHSDRDVAKTPLLPALAPERLSQTQDDLLAEAYPTLDRSANESMRAKILEFAEEVTEGLLRVVELGPPEERIDDATVRVRFSHSRVREDGSPVVWIEFYSPEREVYLIPDLSLVNTSALRYVGGDYKEGMAEQFFDGPARLLLSYDRGTDDFVVRPWLSHACSEEAERHFVRSVRSGGAAQESCLGALLDQAILSFAQGNGLIDPELSEAEAHARLHAIASGEILGFSVETSGVRRYTVEYALIDGDERIARLACAIVMDEHPIWGLTLRCADITVA
jgi:hypothetical protein